MTRYLAGREKKRIEEERKQGQTFWGPRLLSRIGGRFLRMVGFGTGLTHLGKVLNL